MLRDKTKSISIRRIQILMAVLLLVISLLLLFTTFRTKMGYSRMREYTSDYIVWERDADKLKMASDYMTEQARCFVETGKREYLDNYFKEADVDRRRDKALESIRTIAEGNEAYEALEAAMKESVALMDREYYAMRLAVAAFGYDVNDYPEAIRMVELSEEDALLPRDKQSVRSREMVFDDVYHMKKESITRNVQNCLDTLAKKVDVHQKTATDALDDMLSRERTLILVAILATLFTMLLTTLLVVSPLLRAVVYIRADQPIPIKGSNEFQFLAKTYNLMYKANKEKTERLTYDATHDQLTGIHNRSGYVFFLKNTNWENSALLLFDVDKFKQINDGGGHEVGDRALVKVADTILKSFRSQDHVCRIGGDEFAVIMVHTDPGHTELVKAKVARINEILGRGEDGLPRISVSCGVAFGDESQDTEDVFRRADEALYAVKATGGHDCRIGV